jgi:hypothetical protein
MISVDGQIIGSLKLLGGAVFTCSLAKTGVNALSKPNKDLTRKGYDPLEAEYILELTLLGYNGIRTNTDKIQTKE